MTISLLIATLFSYNLTYTPSIKLEMPKQEEATQGFNWHPHLGDINLVGTYNVAADGSRDYSATLTIARKF